MELNLKKYFFLVLLATSLFISPNLYSQANKSDSIAMVKTYQEKAVSEISKQRYSQAIGNLSKAVKLVSLIEDTKL